MSDTSDLAFLGEIRCFPYDFVPYGWLVCDGREVNARQHSDLAALIRTIYGGNPANGTFALPDLVTRVAVSASNSSPYTNRQLAATGGYSTVTLGASNLPNHTHPANVNITGTMALEVNILPGNNNDPTANTLARPLDGSGIYSQTPNDRMGSGTVSVSAEIPVMGIPEDWALPHENVQPCLAMVYCICWNGLYPTFG